MGGTLIIIGIISLIVGAALNAWDLKKEGYSIDDQDRGLVPLDGSVISKTTSLLILAGWGCLIIGGIIIIASFF